MDTLSLSEIARGAVFGGNGKNIAASDDGDALAVGRRGNAGEGFGDVGEGGPGRSEVFADGDRHGGGFLGGEVELPDLAGLLEDDGFAAERGEFHVEVGELRELLGLFRGEVVAEKVGARGAF